MMGTRLGGLMGKKASNADLVIRVTVGYAIVGVAIATLVTIGMITHGLNRRRKAALRHR